MYVNAAQLFLWDQRTLFIGSLSDKIELSQGAATLTVSLGEPLLFQTPSMARPIATRSILLPPSLDIEVDTRGSIIANCNLDPLLKDWFGLHHSMLHHEYGLSYELDNEEWVIGQFQTIHQQQLGYVDAYRLLEGLLNTAKGKVLTERKLDPRIETVINHIKDSVDDNVSVEALAAKVNLSAPRLIQIFKQQTGVPIRRYRQWHRLYTTAVEMGKGVTLTEAALHAGFSDSAHFTNTFKSMLGMKPSDVLSQSQGIRIYTPEIDH